MPFDPNNSATPTPHAQFPNLFSPITVGKVTLRNRIVMLPMGSRFARDGGPTEGDFAFYRARARGGVGLIITGAAPVHITSTTRNHALYEPFRAESLPALSRLADEVHSEGAAIFGQVFHRGRETLFDSEWPTWGPSAVPSPTDPQIPHIMTLAEIEEMIDAFGRSAANLRKCGFDGIEIHAAHGYLVAQFLSAQANRREDRYGGSPQNRMRFLLDIIDSIRANVDSDCVLGVRMSADEGEDVVNGIKLPYTKEIAKAIAGTGKVDYLSVTIGMNGSYVKDMSVPVGPTVSMAAAIREVSGLPVIAGQRINQPPLAEATLASGAADMIGMARPFIVDSDWVAKARDGRVEEIRPCIACDQVCRSGIMGCVHSPTAGRETVWGPGSLKPASLRRKVLVVGGGPAGMEAAIQAAERGHTVVLFEAGHQLGGQVRVAALAPCRAEIDGVVAYRISELNRLRVQVHLGVRADVDTVLAENPDVVVIATGAVPAAAEVEGGELSHVIDVLRALEPDSDSEALLASASNAVVVDDGSGFWETCGAAEALGKRGLRVNFVSPARSIGANVPTEALGPLMRRLYGLGVTLLPMHRVSTIKPGKLLVYDSVRLAATRIREEKELLADVVVYYSGKNALAGLAAELRGKVAELHLVGDCVSPRHITQAVYEGHRVGRSL